MENAIAKRSNIEAIITKLLAAQSEISLADVANAAGLSKSNEADRKAVRRALNSLIKRGMLQAKGTTRARVYFRIGPVHPEQARRNEPEMFRDFSLSPTGKKLLNYVSQSPTKRNPAGYHRDFLRSYEPNQTFYLGDSERRELLRLGKAETKVRPAGTYARNILNRLLIDLSWNSSRLEGNTYSLLETKRLIEFGESVAEKDLAETQMILNHKEAIEYIIETAGEEYITSHQICSIHALLSENLLGDPSASGRIRRIAVGIQGTTYLPLENPHLIEEHFQLFVKKLNQIKDPFEQSFFSLVQLSYLQAFEDVNKRTARLVANIPLIKKNLKPLSFTDVDKDIYVKSLLGIYEKNDASLLRDLYLWAYKRSAQRYSAIQEAMGEPNFLKLKYREEIQSIVRVVILEKVPGAQVVHRIQNLLETKNIPKADSLEIFKLIETEILSLHEGNIARFKIRPSEFHEWKKRQ